MRKVAQSCKDCLAGKFISLTGSDNEDDCIDCVVGKYSTVVGSGTAGTACIECLAGK